MALVLTNVGFSLWKVFFIFLTNSVKNKSVTCNYVPDMSVNSVRLL